MRHAFKHTNHSLRIHSLRILMTLAVLAFATNTRAQTVLSTPYTIAVMLSSDHSGCFAPGVTTAIKHFTKTRLTQLNRTGGINGKPVRIQFYDDFTITKKTVTNFTKALADPTLLGIVGLSSSTRGKAIIASVGESGVPFISGMSRDDYFFRYKNTFSIEPAARDEILVVQKFVSTRKFKRPAYVGFSGDLYAERYRLALAHTTPDGTELISHRFPQRDDFSLSDEAVDRAVADIKAQQADVVFLAIHSGPGARFIEKLNQAGVTIPIFVALGRIERMRFALGDGPMRQNMYQLAREGIPNIFNERLRQRIWRNPHLKWIFQDKRISNPSPECAKQDTPRPVKSIEDRRNRRAIGRGIQYADALEMIITSAQLSGIESPNIELLSTKQAASHTPNISIIKLRKRISQSLRSLAKYRKIHRGWWQDWSFTPGRSSTIDPMLVHQPSGITSLTLAAQQYTTYQGDLVPVPVLYTGVDMTKIYNVDSSGKTFTAEFYLTLQTSGGLTLKDIELSNAHRSPLTNKPIVSIRELQLPRSDMIEVSANKTLLYKVIGKFRFEPNLENYPFDKQRFSISLQPSQTARSFLIQPPPKSVRKKMFDADGWQVESEYVGTDRDIISVFDAKTSSSFLMPLNTFNYTWTMKRVATDYYLQVLVPLIVILLVTYLSVFIPGQRLESVVAIQVTALLSSIALYLAIPKVSYDHATTSDFIFVVTYLAISATLGLSILRVSKMAAPGTFFGAFIQFIQYITLPLVVAGMVDYVFAATTPSGETTFSKLWPTVKAMLEHGFNQAVALFS